MPSGTVFDQTYKQPDGLSNIYILEINILDVRTMSEKLYLSGKRVIAIIRLVLLGMKIKPLTVLERFFITHASTAHKNSDCSDLLGNFSCDQTMQNTGQILDTSEVPTRAAPLLKPTSLNM